MYLYSHIRPDFVMNFTPKMNIYSTIASIISRSKVINNISGLGTVFIKDSILLKFMILLYRFTQIFAAKVFFQNKDDMNMFISQKIIPKKKCEYIPGSGVDLEWFGVGVGLIWIDSGLTWNDLGVDLGLIWG